MLRYQDTRDAEGGGQIGDRGELREQGGGSSLFAVTDTQRPVAGLIVHRGTLHGRLRVGETVTAEVDEERRTRTMRNHTGTHLLHRALRNVVGERARQAGSLVTPDYLRFDFPLDRAVTDSELGAVESEVRRIIREDRAVTAAYTSMREAIDQGADAFFDEKYGETVRTVRVEGYSHELCGGTHCRATGQIGSFLITGERSIGSGMRRIEALTGDGADALVDVRLKALDKAAEAAGAQSVEGLAERVAVLQEELRETRRRLKAGGGSIPKPGQLRDRVRSLGGGLTLFTFSGPFESTDAMKGFAKDASGDLGVDVVAVAMDADEPQVFVTVGSAAVGKGLSAGDLVKEAAAAIEGKGGGRPEMAQGRGTRREGVPDALSAIEAAIRSRLEPSG